jgi:hypothetical protein
MIVYKLTDENAMTRLVTHWEIGVMNRAGGEGGLCGPGWLHCYEHPLLAVMHDPIHGNFGESARMFRCKTLGKVLRDRQMKMGCYDLTPIEEIPLPSVTKIQRVAYAIYCAKEVYHDPAWNAWADKWLSGDGRTAATWADAAAWAARAAEAAAADAAAWAAWAARAADACAACGAAPG